MGKRTSSKPQTNLMGDEMPEGSMWEEQGSNMLRAKARSPTTRSCKGNSHYQGGCKGITRGKVIKDPSKTSRLYEKD